MFLVLSCMDMLVTPRADKIAQAHERLAGLFDGVLVHGDRAFLPLDASWPVVPELAGRLHYARIHGSAGGIGRDRRRG